MQLPMNSSRRLRDQRFNAGAVRPLIVSESQIRFDQRQDLFAGRGIDFLE